MELRLKQANGFPLEIPAPTLIFIEENENDRCSIVYQLVANEGNLSDELSDSYEYVKNIVTASGVAPNSQEFEVNHDGHKLFVIDKSLVIAKKYNEDNTIRLTLNARGYTFHIIVKGEEDGRTPDSD